LGTFTIAAKRNIALKTCWYTLCRSKGTFVSGSTSNIFFISGSLPATVAIPPTSNFTTLGFVLMANVKLTTTFPLFRSFSSKFTLTLKLADSASLFSTNLTAERRWTSTVIETSDVFCGGGIFNSSDQFM